MPVQDRSMEALTRSLVEARGRRARVLAGWRAGARRSAPLDRVHARAPELTTLESAQAVLERLPSAPESERSSLRRLGVALVEEHAEAHAARALGGRLEALAGLQVKVDLDLLSLPEAMAERLTCEDRGRRTSLARAEGSALEQAEPALAHRVERLLETRSRLELAPEAAWSALLELEVGALAAAAEQLLRDTRDATQDLLEFRKRRARVDGRSSHDVELALELLDLREHLGPPAVSMLSERLARDLGLDPSAAGRIAVDAEPRPGRFPGLLVARFSQEELAVVVAPMQSPADLARRAQGLGEALHLASVGGRVDLVDRALLDGALPRASGLLWSSVLGDPAWHRRGLRVPSRPARELAGAFALRSLVELRVAATRLLVARELESSGPTPRVREHHRERLGQALGADVPGHGAFELSLRAAAEELRAFALAAQLQRALLEGFNDDWWRNPHAAELLRAFWTPGGAVKLEGLLGAPIALERTAKLLVERASS